MMASEFKLSKGALKDIMSGERVDKPILQFIACVDLIKSGSASRPRKIQLSDGLYTVVAQASCCFSLTQKSKDFPVTQFAVVVLTEFSVDIQLVNGIKRKVLVIIKLEPQIAGPSVGKLLSDGRLLDLNEAPHVAVLRIPQAFINLIGPVKHNQHVSQARNLPGIISVTANKVTPFLGQFIQEHSFTGISREVTEQACQLVALDCRIVKVPVRMWPDFAKNGNKLLNGIMMASGATLEPDQVEEGMKPICVVGLVPAVRKAVELINSEMTTLRRRSLDHPEPFPLTISTGGKSPESTIAVLIPVDLVPAFIGDRERLLKEIRTSCRVKINPEANDEGFKPLAVTGPPDRVDQAVERIREEVRRLRQEKWSGDVGIIRRRSWGRISRGTGVMGAWRMVLGVFWLAMGFLKDSMRRMLDLRIVSDRSQSAFSQSDEKCHPTPALPQNLPSPTKPTVGESASDFDPPDVSPILFSREISQSISSSDWSGWTPFVGAVLAGFFGVVYWLREMCRKLRGFVENGGLIFRAWIEDGFWAFRSDRMSESSKEFERLLNVLQISAGSWQDKSPCPMRLAPIRLAGDGDTVLSGIDQLRQRILAGDCGCHTAWQDHRARWIAVEIRSENSLKALWLLPLPDCPPFVRSELPISSDV